MIIKDDKAIRSDDWVNAPVENPPPYSPSHTTSNGQSSSLSGPSPSGAPPQLLRSNFLSIKRHNRSLKKKFLIDPAIAVPESVLAPLARGELERKNLQLHCENGSLDAEVWLVACDSDEIATGPGKDVAGCSSKKIATIDVQGKNGFVSVKMHADESSPFHLMVTAANASVTVAIPRAFTGPLTMQTHNAWVTVATSLASQVTTFSDVKSVRKCFVGDFTLSNYGRGEWKGSTLSMNCHNARIKLCYVDEVEGESEGKSGWGFWGKLFGS